MFAKSRTLSEMMRRNCDRISSGIRNAVSATPPAPEMPVSGTQLLK